MQNASNEGDNGRAIDESVAEVQALLKKKGTPEILTQLADEPKRFGEINRALHLSHGTVSKRLNEGARLKLWTEEIRYPSEGGKEKRYQLTDDGRSLAKLAKDENIGETTKQMREVSRQHADAVANFQNRVDTSIRNQGDADS